VSAYLRDWLAGIGFNPRLRRVIHNGVPLEQFTASPVEDWAWRLLYVGRLDPRKGVHVAIEALASLPSNTTLEIVGGGDSAYLKELEALARECGNVSFSVRDRSDLPSVYAAADAVLFPAEWEEPFGLVPLEAMACGRPVITTATGGSAEYLEDDFNCLVYPRAGGEAALAAAVRRLADDGLLRARLTENGLRTAARFPECHFTAGICEELERAIASRAGAHSGPR